MSQRRKSSLTRLSQATVNSPIVISVQPIQTNTCDLDDHDEENSLDCGVPTSSNIGNDISNPADIEMSTISVSARNESQASSAPAENVGDEIPRSSYQNRESPISYFHKYLKSVYCLGTSPLETSNATTGKSMFSSASTVLQLLAFIIFTTFATIESLKRVKSWMLIFAKDRTLINMVMLALVSLNFVGRLAFIHSIGFNSRSFFQMIKTLDNFPGRPNETLQHCSKKILYLPCFLGIASLLCSILSSVFGGYSIREWSFNEMLKDHSYSLATGLFVWDKSNSTVKIIQNSVYEQASLGTMLLGVLEIAFQACGYLQDFIVEDLVLIAAKTLSTCVTQLDDKIHKAAVGKTYTINFLWNDYRSLRNLSKITNATIGYLMIFMHFNHLRLFAFVVLTALDEFQCDILLFVTIFRITKSSYTYYIASNTSYTNNHLRSWIHKRCGETEVVKVGKKIVNYAVLLDELKTHRIGLGEDMFHIDKDFIKKFLTVAASYLLFFVKEEQSC